MSATALEAPPLRHELWFEAEHLYDVCPADLLLDLCHLSSDRGEIVEVADVVVYHFDPAYAAPLGRLMSRLTYHGVRFSYFAESEVAHAS